MISGASSPESATSTQFQDKILVFILVDLQHVEQSALRIYPNSGPAESVLSTSGTLAKLHINNSDNETLEQEFDAIIQGSDQLAAYGILINPLERVIALF